MTEHEYQIENTELRLLIKEQRKRIAELLESIDRCTAVNKHYLNHFFGGDVMKMKETFFYLSGDQRRE